MASRTHSPRTRLLMMLACIGVALAACYLALDTAHASPGDPTEYYNWTELDYKGKNIIGEPMEKGDPPMSPPMILMLMNFAVVLIIIGWKVRPLVSRYVTGRHEDIKKALDEATELREQAKAKLDQYDEQLKQAEAEVDKIIADIRASAENEKKRIMADAEAQATAMQKDAESRIAAEISHAREELQREVIAAAVEVAEKLIRVQATKRDHTSLIENFITDVATSSASSQERN